MKNKDKEIKKKKNTRTKEENGNTLTADEKRRSQLEIRVSSRMNRGREREQFEQVSDGTADSFSEIMATGPTFALGGYRYEFCTLNKKRKERKKG